MQCLPFFVLLLDPANTGGLARRCCTSILSLHISRDALDLGALPGIFQEVNRHRRVEHRVGEDEDRQLPVLGEEIGGKREDADEQGGHKDPRHPIVPALPELFRRAVDFQFMNIFLPLEGEHYRVENQLNYIECEKAVTNPAADSVMLDEYEVYGHKEQDRDDIQQDRDSAHEP